MAFFDDLAGTDTHADLVLALKIEGVPLAFVERTVPAAVAVSIPSTQLACITRVEEGEAVLDIDERRELAATLQIDLLDDDAKTLATLFSINRRRQTWLTVDAAAAATSLTVFDTTGLVSGQTIYTDGETITIGTVASGISLTGCTRGAFGSTARALYGATTGYEDPIYIVPPSWRGRRAYLYGYTLDAAGGGNEQLLGTWLLDEPPRHTGDLSWSLSLASCAQEYYERSIGVGLSDAKVTDRYATTTVGGRQAYEFPVDNATAFRASSTWPSYVIARAGDSAAIFDLANVDTANNKIAIYPEVRFRSDFTGWQFDRFMRTVESLQQITMIGGVPVSMAYLLISKEGQGATTYDQLPGRLQTATDPGWRFGAGFAVSEVDVASWEAFPFTRPFNVVVDKEQKASDVLREWCRLNGAATRITYDGKLSVFQLATPRVTSSTTLGTNSVIPDSRIEVIADESTIYPIATARCDYSPTDGDFRVEINLIDTATAKRYPRTQERQDLEFRTLGVADYPGFRPNKYANPASVTIGELQTIAADIQRGDNGLARRYVSLSLTMAHLGLRIGDVVTLSGLPDAFSNLPDMRGGTLAGAQCRVVSRRPRYDAGRVDVRLLVFDKALVVSPGAVISSIAATTLTLATTGPEVSGTSPADDYFPGQAVRIYDISGAVYHSTTVVARVSATQLTITAAPAFVIAGGIDYIVADPAATTVDGTTTSGYTESEFAALAGSSGYVNTLAVATTYEPRWR